MKLYQLLVLGLLAVAGAENVQYSAKYGGKWQMYASDGLYSCIAHDEQLKQFVEDSKTIAKVGKDWLEILQKDDIPSHWKPIAVAADILLGIKYSRKAGGKIEIAQTSKARIDDIIKKYNSVLALSVPDGNPITLACGEKDLSFGTNVPRNAKGVLPYGLKPKSILSGSKSKSSLVHAQYPTDKTHERDAWAAWYNLEEALIIPHHDIAILGDTPFTETGSEVWSTPQDAKYPVIMFSPRFWNGDPSPPLSLDYLFEQLTCMASDYPLDELKVAGSYILRHLLIMTTNAIMVTKSIMIPQPSGPGVMGTIYYQNWEGAKSVVSNRPSLAGISAENLRLFALVAVLFNHADFSTGFKQNAEMPPAYEGPVNN